MQRLPKVDNKDITQDELELAKMLIHYHRHAFDVRSAGLLSAKVDPPEVRELLNLLLWLGHGFDIISRGYHITALHEIVGTSAIEIREMLESIRTNGADREIVKELNFLQEQMEAADTLMGYMTDG